MGHEILFGEQTGRLLRIRNRPFTPIGLRRANIDNIKWIIRYTFYAFVFSVPFQEAYVASGTTVPRLLGLALAAFALLQPRLCYAFPPRAFWWFLAYLAIYVLWGSYLILVPPNVPDFNRSFVVSVFTLTQLLALFWISYNLFKSNRVTSGALWALAAGTTLLAVFQMVGITGDVGGGDRMAAFDEQNPNGLATVLALGLLALLGLAYGRQNEDRKARWLFWFSAGIICITMVQTGSRGAVVAVAGAISLFVLRGKSVATKLKFGLIGLIGIAVLAIASYQIEAVKKRWERTFYDDSFAGRERIYPESIGMIIERPLVGWGPINHMWELGPRLGRQYRNEHNLYLWLLAEGGLVGAIPFFVALWLCSRSAWVGRYGIQGVLPLVMFLFLLVGGLKGTPHRNKLFWIVLSYSLASSSYVHRRQRAEVEILPAHSPFSNVKSSHGRPSHVRKGGFKRSSRFPNVSSRT
jgi:O-antigen ligase